MRLDALQFEEAARDELSTAARHYESSVPGLGNEFAEEVARALQKLVMFPHLGAAYLHGTRHVLLRRFPFHVVYRVQAEKIVVIAVAHHRRKPGYWRKRL